MIWIITFPEALREEAQTIKALLDAGASRIVLRKPGWTVPQYEQLIREIDPACYNRILIRDLQQLASRYRLAGVHWSGAERVRVASSESRKVFTPAFKRMSPEELARENSTGIHSMEEITQTDQRYSTLLLSPVFDSISKPGYQGKHSGPLSEQYNRKILGLGGIDHTNIHLLKHWYFDGAALLGAIWKVPAKAVDNYCRIQEIWNRNDHT